MNFNKQQDVMNSLINEGPDTWLAYLRSLETGKSEARLNMQVVYHFAAPRARENLDLGWAEVAIRAAEREAKHSSGVERQNALEWAMNLRAWFISKVGVRAEHIVLDQSVVMDWIWEGLNSPLQAIKDRAMSFWDIAERARKSQMVNELDEVARDLHELRAIKRRLIVARKLTDNSSVPCDPALMEWLEIIDQLP